MKCFFSRWMLLFSIFVALQAFAGGNIYEDAATYANNSANDLGAVASVHPIATQAGLDALNRGGNAIDAAVAVALTLGVVDGHNSGIGGGNFAVVHYADGTIEAIDGREMAPAAAHRDMYVREGKADNSLSMTGPLASGVPGSLAVYDYMLRRAGKLSLRDLITPAADIADKGFPLSQLAHDRLRRTAKAIAQFPASAAILLDEKGEPWPAGHWFVQKDLAKTYRHIAEQGIDYFYRGDFAKVVGQWMRNNGGILRYEDFGRYQMKLREPVITDYRGFSVVGFPPPSSGGVHVGQILNILENFEIGELRDEDRYHLLAEAMKLAFADRAHYLGDPDFVSVPKGLIDQQYANNLAKGIHFDKAATDVQPGKPPKLDIDLFGKHTTHISTADQYGNWVAITSTVNTSFGSKVIVPGTGVVLNNQMDDFSIHPGVPNAFGLVGNEANSVQAGKRPLSSMSPTLVLKDNKPIITVGAAGGPTIITQVVQALVNVIDLGMSAEQALAAPRVHNQWKPAAIFTEESLPQSVRTSLEKRGHPLHVRRYLGASQMIMANGRGFDAATEPRVVLRNREVSTNR